MLRATVSRMKKASIRERHIRTSELIRDAANAEPVAELRPLTKARPKPLLPDMTSFWKSFPKVSGDSGRFLEEDR
jgi:hypothetical protein